MKTLIIFILHCLFIANKCLSFFYIIPILFSAIVALNECPNSSRTKYDSILVYHTFKVFM